jgi:aspartyl-tRNA synthetase
MKNMAETSGAKDGDLVLILAGPAPDVYQQMGALRLMVGKDFDLIDDQPNTLFVGNRISSF